MSACVVSVVNGKGGVGKSTIVSALAHSLADNHLRILVIDLDSQASISMILCGRERGQALQEQRLVLDEYFQPFIHGGAPRRFEEFIVHGAGDLLNETCLDLVAASGELRHLDRDAMTKFTLHGLDQGNLRKRFFGILGAAIRSISGSYDLILLDFPPGLTFLAEAAANLSDLLLVPTVPEPVSRIATENVFRQMQDICTRRDGKHRRFYGLINKYDDNLPVHRHELEVLRKDHPSMYTLVPYSEDVIRAGQWVGNRRSFAEKYGEASRVIRELASEVGELAGVG